MAGFARGPYVPQPGSCGWIEEDDEDLVEVPSVNEEDTIVEDAPEEELGEDLGETELVDVPISQCSSGRENVTVTPPPPRWAARLRDWSVEQRLRPPYGMERRFFDLRNGTAADRALPVMVDRVFRINDSVSTLRMQVLEALWRAHATSTRVQELTTGQQRQEQTTQGLTQAQNDQDIRVQGLADELWEAYEEIGQLRTSETNLRRRVESLEAYVAYIGEQLHAAQEESRRLTERLAVHGFI